MPLNVELLTKVKEHILAHPEELDMRNFICGTTACIAGHACLLSGDKPVFSKAEGSLMGVRDASGELRTVGSRAADLLTNDTDNTDYDPAVRGDLFDLFYSCQSEPTDASFIASELDRFIAEHT